MPHMDGIEMCRRLKNDLQSSHIPILFLSARVLDENKLEGFKSGADDYIEKPFSSELLILKIKNILETQRRLKQQYLKIALGKPEIILKSPLDDKFFEQATQIIEKHFSNYEFDGIEFCDEMRLGQKLIYRKIKSVTGLSITEFIRSERLKRAAQLVRENKYTIQEISYKVGFSTPSYFSKCFKKQFGIMPKDF